MSTRTPIPTVTLDVVDLVLRVASATEGAGEQPPETNSGPYVERVQKATGNRKGEAWCASWVNDIGVKALREQWPVLKSGRVQTIADKAADQDVRFVAGKVKAEVGDLFCLYYTSLRRLAHIGFVIAVEKDGKTITTLEGNTSGTGSREGWLVASKTRVLTTRDRLIRWRNLL